MCSGGLTPKILTRPVQCCSRDTAWGRGRRTCTGSEGDRWSYLQRGQWTWQRQRCWRTGCLRSRKTPRFQPDWWSGEKRKYILQKSVWIVSLNLEWMHQNVLKRTNTLENNAFNICHCLYLKHLNRLDGAFAKNTSKLLLQDEMELSLRGNLNFKTGGSTLQSAVPKHSGLSTSLLTTIIDSL